MKVELYEEVIKVLNLLINIQKNVTQNLNK